MMPHQACFDNYRQHTCSGFMCFQAWHAWPALVQRGVMSLHAKELVLFAMSSLRTCRCQMLARLPSSAALPRREAC
jgi:hypothetical protein